MNDKRNTTALSTARSGTGLIERHARQLRVFDGSNATLIPEDVLPALRQEVELSLRAAERTEIGKAVTVLVGSFKTADVIDSPALFVRAMIEELAYPADVLEAAIHEARRKFKWLPSIAEMVEICNEGIGERHKLLRAIGEMERLHRHRRQAEAENAARLHAEEERAARLLETLGKGIGRHVPREEYQRFLKFIRETPISRRQLFDDYAGHRWLWRWENALDHCESWPVEIFRRALLCARISDVDIDLEDETALAILATAKSDSRAATKTLEAAIANAADTPRDVGGAMTIERRLHRERLRNAIATLLDPATAEDLPGDGER